MPSREPIYDLVVVGGGTAGLVTAAGAASLGARTALVERDRLGGECLWTGCVPSKALLGSARIAHAQRTAADFGLDGRDPEADGARVLSSVRDARAAIQPHDDPDRFREMGVEVLEGIAGRLTADGDVEADGRTLAARKVVLATGSRPDVPPVDGLEEAGFVTHEDAFDRDGLPGSAVILGAGAVGVEFAQAYARLGVDVTLVEMEDRILPREDPELTSQLAGILEEEGVRVLTGTRTVSVRRDGEERRVVVEPRGRPESGEGGRADREGGAGEGRSSLGAEEVFVATGRRPNVERLGLDEAGVRHDGEGIEVDARLRTSRDGVYAAGDVVGGHLFTHVADHEARTVVRNALFPFASSEVDYSAVPWAVYTEPELAGVGLSEREARERHGDAVQVFRSDLAELDRAITDRQARGTVKLVAGRRGRLLGGHILAPRAGSLISELTLALRTGTKVPELSDTIHPYPTLSEGIRRAADEYRRARLTDTWRRLFDAWFAVARRLGL